MTTRGGWSEELHPRDPRGRFIQAGDLVQFGPHQTKVKRVDGGQVVIAPFGSEMTVTPGQVRVVKSVAPANDPPRADWSQKVTQQALKPQPAAQPTQADVRAAVGAYAWGQGGSGGLAYAELNAKLRGRARSISPVAQGLQGKLDAAFEQTAPLSKQIKVRRMVSGDRDVYYQLLSAAKGRDTWTDPGYSSTTRDRDILEDFAGQGHEVELDITIPAGAKAIDVDQYTDDSDYKQSEVLLPRDTRFKLGAVTELPGGRVRIAARVVV